MENLNQEKQIKEMAKVIASVPPIEFPIGSRMQGRHIYTTTKIAEALYNADYRKQREGEWIDHSEIGTMNCSWECSCCHWTTVSFTEMKHSKYCPNCGAKMKGGAE